jgi:hypothetical protein
MKICQGRHGQFLAGKAPHSGSHTSGMTARPLLPPPLSILQNPGKALALGALPAVAALKFAGKVRSF